MTDEQFRAQINTIKRFYKANDTLEDVESFKAVVRCEGSQTSGLFDLRKIVPPKDNRSGLNPPEKEGVSLEEFIDKYCNDEDDDDYSLEEEDYDDFDVQELLLAEIEKNEIDDLINDNADEEMQITSLENSQNPGKNDDNEIDEGNGAEIDEDDESDEECHDMDVDYEGENEATNSSAASNYEKQQQTMLNLILDEKNLKNINLSNSLNLTSILKKKHKDFVISVIQTPHQKYKVTPLILSPFLAKSYLDFYPIEAIFQKLCSELSFTTINEAENPNNFWIVSNIQHSAVLGFNSEKKAILLDSWEGLNSFKEEKELFGDPITVSTLKFPTQKGGFDCGIFCLVYVVLLHEKLIVKQESFTPAEMRPLRLSICVEITKQPKEQNFSKIIIEFLKKFV